MNATATAAPATGRVPLVELRDAGKRYGNIIALRDVSLEVSPGEVTCVLGDNGAGKSTLIKIIAGLHQNTEGAYLVEGQEVRFNSPREALNRGIATVYQDLAVAPLMPVWRNFFLGSEVSKGWGPFRRLDVDFMKETAKRELLDMGIDLRDVDQPIGTLSGGERQCVAIARAVYFGAKVLILDEPTAALGVKQSGVVLRYIIQARDRGLGVIFITHNPHHAYPVGDRFLLLKRGQSIGYHEKSEITLEELTGLMAGGAELEQLVHELRQVGTSTDTVRVIRDEIEGDAAAGVGHVPVTEAVNIRDLPESDGK
ncbi:ATP-binding cassette domain-containing protein [Leucobacter sp.]